jgi:AcrR family transcriptional regulator
MALRNAAIGAEGTAPRRGPGRLPKPGATRAILDATRAILEEAGFVGLTIEAIARRAGVGPPALYRRWPSKEALIEAALIEIADEALPIANTGTLRGDLMRLARDFRESLRSPFGRIVVALVGEAIRDSAWRDLLIDFLRRRREHALVIVERAVARGELPRDVDGGHVLDLVSSPLWVHRLLNGDLDEWASDERLERHVDAVLNGIAPRLPRRRPSTAAGHDKR